jgi:hypothetical protein
MPINILSGAYTEILRVNSRGPEASEREYHQSESDHRGRQQSNTPRRSDTEPEEENGTEPKQHGAGDRWENRERRCRRGATK